MIEVENLIIGAGISGLATGQRLKELNKEYIILEKNNDYGGLCSDFEIDGFRFDRFVHLSFAEDERVRKFFDQIPYYTHIPNPENYYHGIWIKHPAQNNLFPLREEEKQEVLNDMKKREKYHHHCYDNYENWLRYQFGDYFAEHFSMVYTKKYWGVEANRLETKWVGTRIYQPTMDEVLEGMKTSDTPITYYAKEMRYPKKGGFKSFLSTFLNEENIRYNQRVIKIDTSRNIIYTQDNQYHYHRLYSSIPLPEYKYLLEQDEKEIITAIEKLHWTSGYIVSLGMEDELLKRNLWDYIYDEDILPARIYSASEKSSDNCPKGCCSIQAEIYFRDDKVPENQMKLILDDTLEKLDKAGIIDRKKVVVSDIRFERYANVIFDHNIYKSRETVVNYLQSMNIIPIGRFGEWDYLWSDQSFLSGYTAINKKVNE